MTKWLFRLLFIASFALWIFVGGVLIEQAEITGMPLVSVSVESWTVVLWLVVGGVLLFLLWGMLFSTSQSNLSYPLLSQINEGVILCDSRGRILWHNESVQSLLGESDKLPDDLMTVFQKARASQHISTQVMVLSDGQRYSVQAMPIEGEQYALILRTSTSNQPNNFYENFIRRIVHDMRNPLAAIIGHASNLRYAPQTESGTGAWQKSATTIENEAQRLARLVDSILFDARLAYVPLAIETLDLADVVEEALFTHEEQAIQEGKILEMNSPNQAMKLHGDRDLLVRAFGNLMDNGLKYTDADGRIEVQLQEEAETYKVIFQDNGQGIAPEFLPDRIFEPLIRGNASGNGSGLGLSIVKKIIEMHHGQIVIESQVGSGTTIAVSLPKLTR